MKYIKIHWPSLVIAALFLCIGVVTGAFLFTSRTTHNDSGCTSPDLHYINPELGCTPASVVDKRGYASLNRSLQDFIQNQVAQNNVSNVSIYFRDLNNGPTLGINEYEKFSPASLLKLPMLMTYLSLEENQSGLGAIQVEYDGYAEDNLEQDIPPKESIVQNTPYTIDDLLTRMIQYSDNRAYYVLRQYLQQLSPTDDLLKNTFVDLGILDPKSILDETITVKSYASIFSQLYYSSFFDTNKSSEKALDILTHVDFTQGLNAGVPANIPIAHKFGERTGFAGGIKQLHDCGIVYYPKNPYLICVMTSGTDFVTLEGVIATISKMVYQEFDSRRL